MKALKVKCLELEKIILGSSGMLSIITGILPGEGHGPAAQNWRDGNTKHHSLKIWR